VSLRRYLILALAALASLLLATPAEAFEGNGSVPGVCHNLGGGDYVLVTENLHEHEGHGDYPLPGFEGAECASNPVAQEPVDPGKDCNGATVPSSFECIEETTTSTTPSTTPPTVPSSSSTTTATLSSTPPASAPESAAPAVAPPTAEVLAPATRLGPTPMTELPRTGADDTAALFLYGAALVIIGLALWTAGRA
jgi:LPXTG-motif cell wall-anchored protein